MLTNTDQTQLGILSKRFDNFLVGRTNEDAVRQCLSLAKGGTDSPNLLMLCGPSPCGKTHLLCSIYNDIRQNSPQTTVQYIAYDTFISRYIEAVHKDDTQAFMRNDCACDVLLVDNIHLLVGLEATQECLSELFLTLCAQGKRIVLACDRPVSCMQTLTTPWEEAISTFKVVQLEKPDFALRKQLLLRELRTSDVSLLSELTDSIAASERISFGAIPGILRTISLLGRITGEAPDAQAIAEVIRAYE